MRRESPLRFRVKYVVNLPYRRHLALKAREVRGSSLRVRVEEELYVVIRERREQVPLDRGEREVEAAIYPPKADGDASSRGRGDRS